jgi:hypothetical protein
MFEVTPTCCIGRAIEDTACTAAVLSPTRSTPRKLLLAGPASKRSRSVVVTLLPFVPPSLVMLPFVPPSLVIRRLASCWPGLSSVVSIASLHIHHAGSDWGWVLCS